MRGSGRVSKTNNDKVKLKNLKNSNTHKQRTVIMEKFRPRL